MMPNAIQMYSLTNQIWALYILKEINVIYNLDDHYSIYNLKESFSVKLLGLQSISNKNNFKRNCDLSFPFVI